MTKYRYTGDYPQEVKVGETVVMMAPGAFVDLSDEDVDAEENAVLKESGLMLNVDAAQQEQKQAQAQAQAQSKSATSGTSGGDS